MSAWLTRWRLALRIARRDARRHKARTLLVVAMVGLPVTAIVAGDTLYRTADVTSLEALPSSLGQADARISGEARDRIYTDPRDGTVVWRKSGPAEPPWTRAEVTAELPDGARVTETLSGRLLYRTDLGYADVEAVAEDTADPVLDGRYELVDGRLPTGDGEVAISRDIARRGYDVGDRLALTRDEVPARVVGVVRSLTIGQPFLLLPEGDADLLSNRQSRFFAAVPGGLDWPAVQRLNALGLGVLSREVAVDPPAKSEWLPAEAQDAGIGRTDTAGIAVLALIVTTLVLEVVLLAGPAFAVGVRRQRRDLALVGAAGGSAGDLRRIVLANGVVLGGGAAALGALAGVGAAAAGLPVIESRMDRVFGPFDVPVLHALATVGVGVLAGLAAAWFPARQAARTNVVDALAGRRGQVRTSWRSPVGGSLLAGLGLALVVLGARGNEFAVAGGAVLLVLGVVTAGPWLVGVLAPIAGRLPTAPRLAVRDATRNRSRTAPAVAAVIATVAGVTSLAIGSSSDSAQAERDYSPLVPVGAGQVYGGGAQMSESDWNAVAALVQREAPDRPVHRLRGNAWTNSGTPDEVAVLQDGCEGDVVTCRWYPTGVQAQQGDFLVADPADVLALGDHLVPDGVIAALESGRVAVLGTGAVDEDGTVTLVGAQYDGRGNGTVVGSARLPAVEIDVRGGRDRAVAANTIVPTSLMDRLPLPVETTSLVTGGPDDPVTAEQERHIDEALSLAGTTGGGGIEVEHGWQDDLALARWTLVLVGGALVLIATLTATGLALTDARPDFATLAAVGAAPRTRRFVAMSSAAVVGGLGAVLGVLVGLAPGIAVAYPLTSVDYGSGGRPVLVIPWLLLGAVAVGVPLLAVAVTGLFVRSRLPLSRRIA